MADFNEGLIFGEVKDVDTGETVEGARAVLTFLKGDAGLPPMRILGKSQSDTDASGRFLIGFQWDPLQLGNLMGIGANPPFHLIVIGPTPDAAHPRVKQYKTTHFDARLYMVVSLRAIANGGIPDFRKPDSVATTIGKQVVNKWRDYKRFPAIRVMQSSPEMYALIGFFSVKLSSFSAPEPTIAGIWNVTIGDWRGYFWFSDEGTAWWAESRNGTRHLGKWWHAGREIQWKFKDAGDIRTFTVTPSPGFITSYDGRISPTGQGFFSMTRVVR